MSKVKRIEKIKDVEYTLIARDVKYTVDFTLYWSTKAMNMFISDFANPLIGPPVFESSYEESKVFKGYVSRIDVKGEDGARKSKNNNSAITFPLKQKWLYQTQGVFVQKIQCTKLFQDTFTPWLFAHAWKTLLMSKL